MSEILACILIAVVISVLVSIKANQILAAHLCKMLDGHIEDVFENIGKFIEDIQKLIDTHFNKFKS